MSEQKQNTAAVTGKRKAYIFSIVGSLVVLSIITLTTIWSTESASRQTSNAVSRVSDFYIQELAMRRAQMVTSEIDRNFNYINNALSIITLEDLKSQKSLRAFLSKIRELFDLQTFSLVDENGIVYNDHSTISGLSRYPFLQKEMTEPVLESVNFYGANKQAILAVPVENLSFKGAKITACFIQINIDQMVKFMTEKTEASETHCNIYFKNGECLTNTDFANLKPGQNILEVLSSSEFQSEKSFGEICSDFNKGKSGRLSVIADGNPASFFYAPIRNTGWVLTILVFDNVISNQINTISNKIQWNNRIQLGIILVSLLILFIAVLILLRRHSKLMLNQEKIISESTREAYDKLNDELEAMNIIHKLLGSGAWSMEFDQNAKLISVNWSDEFRRMLGYESEEEFPNTLESWSNLLHNSDKEMVTRCYWDTVNDYSGKTVYDVEYRMLTKNRGWRWFHAAGNLTRRDDGSPVTYVGLFTDIDDKKNMENSLAEQFSIVNALSRDYKNIFKVDPKLRTTTVIKLEGYVTKGIDKAHPTIMPYENLVSQYIKDRVYQEDIPYVTECMDLDNVILRLKKNPEYVSSYRVVDDGEIHFYQFKYMMLGTGMIIAGFNNIDDVVNAAKERETLIQLSETDLMTGLLNRGSGERKVTDSLLLGRGGLFLLLDVDSFKSYNDTFGHEVGDKVIINVANSLKKAFREEDVVFRLGGDEFSAYAARVQSEDLARKIISRFQKNVENIVIPELGERDITVSIGATVIKTGDPVDFSVIYKMVDTGVYESKKIKGTVVTFRYL